jgi:signal transduction histidine kinase
MFFSVFEISGRLQDLPETQRSSGEYQSAMRASTRTVFVLVVVVVLVIVVVVVASKDSARPCSGS